MRFDLSRLHPSMRPIHSLNKYLARTLTGTTNDLKELNWWLAGPFFGVCLAVATFDVYAIAVTPRYDMRIVTTEKGEDHDSDRMVHTSGTDCTDICTLLSASGNGVVGFRYAGPRIGASANHSPKDYRLSSPVHAPEV